MEEARPQRFNLAWHRADLKNAAGYLCYTLVPDWLGLLQGSMELERISSRGIRLPKVTARAVDLASPRLPNETEGSGHPIEMKLIRVLQVRASQAAVILPEIVPSLTFRRWSQMELTTEQRKILLRAGGL